MPEHNLYGSGPHSAGAASLPRVAGTYEMAKSDKRNKAARQKRARKAEQAKTGQSKYAAKKARRHMVDDPGSGTENHGG